MNKKAMTCKIEKSDNGYEFDCGEERKGSCVISTEGKSGGLSILGSGGSGGFSRPTISCHDIEDLKMALSKKYGEKIRFERKE